MNSRHFAPYLHVLPNHLCLVLSLFPDFLLWFFPILTPFCSFFSPSLPVRHSSAASAPVLTPWVVTSFLLPFQAAQLSFVYCSLAPHSAKALINDNTVALLVVSTNVIFHHSVWKPDSYLEAVFGQTLQCEVGTIVREFHWQADFYGFSKNIQKAILGSE